MTIEIPEGQLIAVLRLGDHVYAKALSFDQVEKHREEVLKMFSEVAQRSLSTVRYAENNNISLPEAVEELYPKP